MKRKLSIIFCLITLSCTKVFASSDLQIGVFGPSITLTNGTFLSLAVENHNFFVNDMFGIAEGISFAPFTVTEELYDRNFMFSVYLGPTVRLPLGDKVDVILTAGFKYICDYKKSHDEMGYSELIIVNNTMIYSTYAVFAEFQMKFYPTEKYSFVIGYPLTAGVTNWEYTQTPMATNQNSKYKTLKKTSDLEEYYCVDTFYIAFSINF